VIITTVGLVDHGALSPAWTGSSGSGKMCPMARLTTRFIRDSRDLVEHFDSLAAPEHFDAHGPAERLLAYRLAIIRRFLARARMGTLLEIGCGTAIHLLPLAERFGQAHGIDVSPEMVRVACRHAETSPWRARISLRVDAAEELATVEDGSVDVVLCVGALEHMLDKPRAVRQVYRVLRVGGVFICLTLNSGYCWYRHLAPRLGLDTRHLSTDRFLSAREVETLIGGAELALQRFEHWRFIPQGDLPVGWGSVLRALDWVGGHLRVGYLRGGIAFSAVRRD
jgi:SAM-dependent methyltransferase